MMDDFHMLRLRPDLRRLTLWGEARGLTTRGDDLGYVLHAALSAAFGELAPKPFRLLEAGSGEPVVLGYGDAGADRLETAAAAGDDMVRACLGIETMASKPMPRRWPGRSRLAFEVRVRPVVRSGTDRAGFGEDASGGKPGRRPRERDAFLQACDAAGDAPVDRAEVYGTWLMEQLARHGGARLPRDRDGRPQTRMDSFQRLRIARRAADRRLRGVDGPDAVLSGCLEVEDPDSFARLLRRGVGRHRAFGYGMLLLKPAAG